jgi:iron-sulfur cluster assembly protein
MSSPAPSPAPALPSQAPVSETSKRTVIITDGAAAFAREKLAQRGTPNAAVRLGIKGGGCSGFSYVIQFDDEPPRERDSVFENQGIRFYVD